MRIHLIVLLTIAVNGGCILKACDVCDTYSILERKESDQLLDAQMKLAEVQKRMMSMERDGTLMPQKPTGKPAKLLIDEVALTNASQSSPLNVQS